MEDTLPYVEEDDKDDGDKHEDDNGAKDLKKPHPEDVEEHEKPEIEEMGEPVQHSSYEDMLELVEEHITRVRFAKEVVEYLINRELDEILLNETKIIIERAQRVVRQLVPPVEFQEHAIIPEEDIREDNKDSLAIIQPLPKCQAQVTVVQTLTLHYPVSQVQPPLPQVPHPPLPAGPPPPSSCQSPTPLLPAGPPSPLFLPVPHLPLPLSKYNLMCQHNLLHPLPQPCETSDVEIE